MNDAVAELGLLPDPLTDAGTDARRRRQSARVPCRADCRIRDLSQGFRSFRDWAAEETDHPREVIEAAMAHVVQNKVEAAYQPVAKVEVRDRQGRSSCVQ